MSKNRVGCAARMARYLKFAVLALGPGLMVLPEIGAQRTAPEKSDRGRYIVESVAMCIQCHTPRNQRGELLRSEYLGGAPVPVSAPRFAGAWAIQAPAIAGLPGYTRDEGIRLLTDGITREGKVPSPPMPPFRMSRQDAEAVVDFLRSLR